MAWYDNVYPLNINPFKGVAEHFGQIKGGDPSTWLGGMSGQTLGILDQRNKRQEQELRKLDQSKGVIDASNPQVMHAGFSWPFGGNQGLESNRPVGIDTPMNYQDQIRTLPGGNYQNWQDRIMDTDLMVNQEYEDSLQDINTNPRWDDEGTGQREISFSAEGVLGLS